MRKRFSIGRGMWAAALIVSLQTICTCSVEIIFAPPHKRTKGLILIDLLLESSRVRAQERKLKREGSGESSRERAQERKLKRESSREKELKRESLRVTLIKHLEGIP